MSAGPVVVAVFSHRDPALLRRLAERVLEGRRTVLAVHHDPRGPRLDLPRDDRVLVVPDPRPCDWGRAQFAAAMVDTVAFCAQAVPDLSWVLSVSGADYPCRSMTRIEDELAHSPWDASLRWLEVGDPADDTHPWQARTRARYLHRRRVPFSRRHVPLPRRHPFRGGTRLFVGDTWPNLGAAAIAHLLAQRQLRAVLEPYLATCQSPDEALLPSLLLNGAAGLRVADDRKRFMRWVEGEPHPRLLVPEDVPDIAAGTDFFARKLDSVRTARVLDLLDELIDRDRPVANGTPNG